MKNWILHVYPEAAPNRPVRPIDLQTERHLVAGASLIGMRADMLYIHPGKWEPDAEAWLKESAMTRLADDNPARVVYL